MKRFSKQLSFLALMAGLVTLMVPSCTKPSEGFTYTFNSSVFNYTASIRVVDPVTGNVPASLKATVVGASAANVYDLSGFRALRISGDGLISFALGLAGEPSGTASVPVTILLEAPGFRDENVTVTFTQQDRNLPVRDVRMLNLVQPTQGVAVVVAAAPVSGNTVTAPVTVSTPPPAGNVAQTAAVTIPANTQLRDVAGNPVNTSSVNVNVVNLDVEKPSSLAFIPNATLVQPVQVGASTQTVAFAPASITTIEMTAANGTPIRQFNQPIQVVTRLDPTMVNPNTNAPIQAGNVLDYYSYNPDNNRWTFESSGVVVNTGGILTTTIPVTHLSTWMSVVRILNTVICGTPTANLRFTSSYMPDQSTDRYTVSFFSSLLNKVVSTETTTISAANPTLTFSGLLLGNYTVTVTGPTGVIGTAVINFCGNPNPTMSINIPAPTTDQPRLTVKINGICASGSATRYGTNAPQGTVVQYRQTNSGPFTVLGSVEQDGSLTTNLLNINRTYDFRTSFVAPDGRAITITKDAQNLTTVQNDPRNSDVVFLQSGLTASLTFTYTVNQRWCQ